MTIQLIVREVNLKTFHHERYFTFDLDDGKDFCYRSRMSSNAFFHGGRSKKNAKANSSPTHLYVSDHLDEPWVKTRLAEDLAIFPQVQMVSPINLWDFYRIVGYDYRKKKWI